MLKHLQMCLDRDDKCIHYVTIFHIQIDAACHSVILDTTTKVRNFKILPIVPLIWLMKVSFHHLLFIVKDVFMSTELW